MKRRLVNTISESLRYRGVFSLTRNSPASLSHSPPPTQTPRAVNAVGILR